jgi:hypothetical protein
VSEPGALGLLVSLEVSLLVTGHVLRAQGGLGPQDMGRLRQQLSGLI